MTTSPRYDLLVIGSGAAGLSAALEAADLGLTVSVVSKGALWEGSTSLAQGGLAAVLAADDTVGDHVDDTVTAGAGLCKRPAVEVLAGDAPGEIHRLLRLGATFDTDPDGQLSLGREGGHRRRRIVHAGGDATGAEVQRTLVAALADTDVEVHEHVMALDLAIDQAGRVGGVLVADVDDDGTLDDARLLRARNVLVATGGMGQVFAVTTNPSASTGDGMAMALRAGVAARDMEFVQFHPTALWSAGGSGQRPLVSEAVRGEGATLVDATGASVMAGVHPMGDLAPRDIVATAIAQRMRQAPGGVSDHVFLDATSLGKEMLTTRFPSFVAACAAEGLDPAVDLIPVAPAAHFACGGVAAELDGRTALPGLLIAGEVAATGIHGANRLASNGVTEGLVAGRRAAHAAREDRSSELLPVGELQVPTPSVCPAAERARIQDAMTRLAGPLRDADRLAQLASVLASVSEPPEDAEPLTLADVETANIALVASAIATSAMMRTESRGCHRRDDAPEPSSSWDGHVEVRLLDGQVVAAFVPAGVPV